MRDILKLKDDYKHEVKQEKKLIEFSKKIMFFIMMSAFAVILFTMYIIFKTKNLTPLNTLIVEVFNFSKVAVMFYYSKACVENFQKIKSKDVILKLKEKIENEI